MVEGFSDLPLPLSLKQVMRLSQERCLPYTWRKETSSSPKQVDAENTNTQVLGRFPSVSHLAHTLLVLSYFYMTVHSSSNPAERHSSLMSFLGFHFFLKAPMSCKIH